ncbi:protoporphyrinogen/coproporphyrinogen III oxidase [Pseudoscourfieldia marina]
MRDEDDGDASVNASAAADAPAVDRWTQQAISARERSLAAKRSQRRDAVSQFLEGVRLPFGIKLNRAAPTNDASGDDSTTSAGAANSHIHADRKEYDAKRDQPQQQQQQQARPPSVAVVGASLSGLVAAFRLKQAGANVTVFESRDAARGSVVTRYEDGFLWEEALDACRDDHPCVRKLIRDLNLVDQVSWPSSRQRAEDGYLVRRGNRSHVAPRGLGSFLTTNLVSPGGKLRAIAEPFAWRRRRRRRRLLSWKGSEAVAADDGIDADEESASDFLARHFGREIGDFLLDPHLAVPHGASAASVPASVALPHLVHIEQTHGSIVMGLAARKLPRLRLPWRGNADGIGGRDLLSGPQWEAEMQREVISFDGNVADPQDGGLRDGHGSLSPWFIPPPLRRRRGSFTFYGGMRTLPDALIAEIGPENIRLRSHVSSLNAEMGTSPPPVLAGEQQEQQEQQEQLEEVVTSRWRVRTSPVPGVPGTQRWRSPDLYDAVVFAVPSCSLRDGDLRVTESGKPVPLGWLPKVERDPIAMLTLAFKEEAVQLPPRGAGIALPASEPFHRCLGVRFSSALNPEHAAPKNFTLLTVFLGGGRDPSLAASPRIDQVTAALADVRACSVVKGSPVLTRATVRHDCSLSYATGGAMDVRTALAVMEDGVPGLYMSGKDLAGPNATLHMLAGERAASRVLSGMEAERRRLREAERDSAEETEMAAQMRDDMLERRRARWDAAEEMLMRADEGNERKLAAAAAFNATQSLPNSQREFSVSSSHSSTKGVDGERRSQQQQQQQQRNSSPRGQNTGDPENKVWGRKELPKSLTSTNVRNLLPPGHENMSEAQIWEWRRREEKRRARKVAEEVRRELLEERLVAKEQRLRMRDELRREKELVVTRAS